MKKWFLILALVFGSTTLQAGFDDKDDDDCFPSYLSSYGDGCRDEYLCFKAIVPVWHREYGHDVYFMLSDGSYWKIAGFMPRWKGPNEWIGNDQNVPENYVSNPKDWALESKIEVYDKEDYLDNVIIDSSNQQEIYESTHLLVNTTNGQMVFATTVDSVDSLGTLSHYTYKNAHRYGQYRPGLYPAAKHVSIDENAALALHLTSYRNGNGVTTHVLTEKATFLNDNGYFVLSDGTCWRVLGFAKRWRTLSEWWHNATIIPESYEAIPNDWLLGSEITIYPKNEYLTVDERDASNHDQLVKCTHLFVNRSTGEVLFAKPLEPTDCILHAFDDAFHHGYYNGWHGIDVNESESLVREDD